jgi:hypothetical protein
MQEGGIGGRRGKPFMGKATRTAALEIGVSRRREPPEWKAML